MSNWKGGFDGVHFTLYEAQEKLSKMLPVGWVKYIVIHNTSLPSIEMWKSTPGGSKQRILNLAHYYRDNKSWSSGPHVFISPEGGIFWGTPLTETGTHSPSWNSSSWGVELAGDFNKDDPNSSDGLVITTTAARLVAELLKNQGLGIDALRFHYEDPKTTHKSCPGKHLVKEDFLALVKKFLIETTTIKEDEVVLFDPGKFSASDFCRSWAKRFEGKMLKAYWDKSDWAIGYGHNNGSGVPPSVKEGMEITEEEAEKILDADLALQARYINILVKVPLTQGQIDALILHVFQQGPGNFRRGKVLPLVNVKDFEAAADTIKNWPTKLAGLQRRRLVESQIFKGERPIKW